MQLSAVKTCQSGECAYKHPNTDGVELRLHVSSLCSMSSEWRSQRYALQKNPVQNYTVLCDGRVDHAKGMQIMR